MSSKKALSASVIAILAVMTAITVIFTLSIQIPIPQTKGYISLADVAIYFAAFAFGPLVGGFSAGVGTGLADVLSSYTLWAPFSLVVHGLQGVAAGIIVRRGKNSLPSILLGWAVGSLIMVAGYLLAGTLLVSFEGALGEVVFNLVQVSVGGLGGGLLYFAVLKAFPSLLKLGNPPAWEEE